MKSGGIFFVLLPLVAGLLIKNVPYHRQITEFSCGDATMEMLLHWSGMDVDQRAIMDVMRTSSYEGTLSFDMQRALHFSEASAAPANGLYPDFAPISGWTGRYNGLASFARRDTSCWVDELVETLDSGYPVGVLMHYADPQAHDGHFRVVIGHDEARGTITLLDPWDRAQAVHAQFVQQAASLHSSVKRSVHRVHQTNKSQHSVGENKESETHSRPQITERVEGLQPRVLVLPQEEFCALWNYKERNFNDTFDPYFGVVGAPFQISVYFTEDLVNSTLDIFANITYPLPRAFFNVAGNLSAFNTYAIIDLPKSLTLASGQHTVPIGVLQPGATASVRWTALSDDSLPKATIPTFITVSSYGYVRGSVPDMEWSNNITRPGYQYTDIIGGQSQTRY